MKIKSYIVLFIISAFITSSICLTSCKNQEVEVVTNSTIQESATQPEIEALPEQDETPPDNQQEPQPDITPIEQIVPEYINPLNGCACSPELVTLRPLAVMVNNIKKATPQAGVSNADIIYECIVEGGITRLMCLFSEYENLPLLGSVRSSRDYYIDLAQAHDAIYAHCGGSMDAYSVIYQRGIDKLDGVNGSYTESRAFWKDSERVKTMGYEHASMTNGQSIAKAINEKNYRTALQDGFQHPLKFNYFFNEIEGVPALSLNIKYSFYASSFFSYDVHNAVYKKGQYNAPHIDSNNGEILTFSNIIVLYSPYKNTGDAYNHMIMNLVGQGNGVYITGGKAKDIIWKKADSVTPYTLYEADGITPLLLNPGKSYIGITNSSADVTICQDNTYAVD